MQIAPPLCQGLTLPTKISSQSTPVCSKLHTFRQMPHGVAAVEWRIICRGHSDTIGSGSRTAPRTRQLQRSPLRRCASGFAIAARLRFFEPPLRRSPPHPRTTPRRLRLYSMTMRLGHLRLSVFPKIVLSRALHFFHIFHSPACWSTQGNRRWGQRGERSLAQ